MHYRFPWIYNEQKIRNNNTQNTERSKEKDTKEEKRVDNHNKVNLKQFLYDTVN